MWCCFSKVEIYQWKRFSIIVYKGNADLLSAHLDYLVISDSFSACH